MKRTLGWLSSPIPVSILLALLIGAGFMLLAGTDPITGYAAMIKGSFGSGIGFATTLQRAIPIIGIAIAISLAFRAGVLNLGTEGQMVLGSLAGGVVALYLPGPAFLVLLAAVVTGIVVGALWGLLAAFFQTWLGVPVLLTTLLLNYPARYFASWAIRFKLKDEDSEMVASEQLDPSVQIPMLAGRDSSVGQALTNAFGSTSPLPQVLASVNWSLVIVALLVVGAIFLNRRTRYGFEAGISGQNSAFARYSGVQPGPLTLKTMALSGGIAGLMGVLLILGAPNTRLIEGGIVQTNYAWTALLVTLLAAYRPLGIAVSGIFFGAIMVGAAAMGRELAMSPQISSVIQALVIILIAYRVALPKPKKQAPAGLPSPEPGGGDPQPEAKPTAPAPAASTSPSPQTAPAGTDSKERP